MLEFRTHKVLSYDLPVSQSTSVTNRQTDGQMTTMPTAGTLLKYCRLKIDIPVAFFIDFKSFLTALSLFDTFVTFDSC